MSNRENLSFLANTPNEVPRPEDNRVIHFFNKHKIMFSKMIPECELTVRSINQPELLSMFDEYSRSLILKLKYELLSGREIKTVDETYDIPVYTEAVEWHPASTWDAVKREIDMVRNRLNQWMANVRWSGCLFTKESRSNVELWLLKARVPYEMKSFRKSILVKTKKIDKTTTIKRYCHHNHGTQSTANCVNFLSAETQREVDKDFIEMFIPYLKTLKASLEKKRSLYYSFESLDSDGFANTIHELGNLLARYSK